MSKVARRTREMCDLYRAGSKVKEIAAIYGVLNPAVWKALRRGGVLPPYSPKDTRGPGRPVGGGNPGYTARRNERSLAAIVERERKQPPVPEVIIARDPCFNCGVRADVHAQFGCKRWVVK